MTLDNYNLLSFHDTENTMSYSEGSDIYPTTYILPFPLKEPVHFCVYFSVFLV